MTNTRIIAELQSAAEETGCAVCRLLERDERRFFEALLYEQITDVQRRQQIQRALGFCAAHATVLSRLEGAPMGVAIVARSLLGNLLKQAQLRAAAAAQPPRRLGGLLRGAAATALAVHLRPQEHCPACIYLNEQTSLYVMALFAQVTQQPFAASYARSDGLCLPHLALALERQPPAPVAQALLDHQRKQWQHLADVLDEFIRKHDYRYSGEALTPEEQGAWRRALLLLTGTRSGRDEVDRS